MSRKRTLLAVVVAMTLAGCTPEPAPTPTPTANTVSDYTKIINTTKPKFEEAADADLCILEVIMEPHSNKASDCITLATDTVNSMTRIKTRFEELDVDEAPTEIATLVTNTHHMAAVFLDSEDFNVRAACEDPASDECATAAGGVIMAAKDTILPQIEEWEPHLR